MADADPNIPLTDPEAAVFLAIIYEHLGGRFSIGSNGKRYFGRPEPIVFELNGTGLPQLAGARPSEQFHNADQWNGAIKLCEGLLRLLSEDHTDLIFDLFATVAVDDRKFTPSIEEPRRAQ